MCGEAADETGAETQEARGGGSRVCPIFQDSLFSGFFTVFRFYKIFDLPEILPEAEAQTVDDGGKSLSLND